MPKNKKKNSFFFFMIDWKKRAEARGMIFPNGLKDVQANHECNTAWQTLSPEDKSKYVSMAKDDRITSQIKHDPKTTFGESISMLNKIEEEKNKFLKDMRENIQLTIDTAVNLNILTKVKFCFVHVNWFVRKIINNTMKYFPAEYALGVFSLEDGIEDAHHNIVSAELPLGFQLDAQTMSEATHKIPAEYRGGETDFAIMYKKLTNFLECRKIGGKYPPLYTKKADVGAVQSLLEKLCDATGEDESQFKVYELESLFISLANEAYKKRPDRDIKFINAYAETVFSKSCFNYEKGFECAFHKFEEQGPQYCSKSILRQWAWILCAEFCVPLRVNVRPNVHYPDKSNRDVSNLTDVLNNMQIQHDSSSRLERKGLLSMTGVREQHRLEVSSRTYAEDMMRRNNSKPIKIISSKMKESVDNSVDKSVDESSDEQGKYASNYLSEKPMRPPNIYSCVAAASTLEDSVPKNDEINFPRIGGRGSTRSRFERTKMETSKPPLGKGQGYI